MRKMKKIALAGAVLTLALGSGLVVTNFANASSDVLSGLAMNEGMSIRMNEPEGLRFSATIDMTKAEMESAGIVEVGTILMPESQVNGTLEYNEKNGDVEALLIPTAYYFEQTADASSWYSVLVNTGETGEFPASFYNTPIMARAYAKYSDGSYKYSANTMTKSIGYVAAMHYLSGNAGDEFGVIAKIASQTSQALVLEDTLSIENTNGYQATVTVGGQTAQAIEGMSVVWSVEGDAVTVDQTGKVTPVKGGNATVSVTISVAGGNATTLTKAVTVTVPETKVSEDQFVIRQTNDSGEMVVNDYTYELTGENVTSVTLAGNELDASAYAVNGNELTVYGEAFIGYDGIGYFDVAQKLVVTTDLEKVEVTFGRVVTFAVTKASDVHTGSASKAAPLMAAGGLADGARSKTQGAWQGYFILANDIDFDFATITHNAPCFNYGLGAGAGFAGIFDGQGYTFKNFRLAGDNNSFFGQIVGGSVIKNTKFVNFRTAGSAQYHSNFGLFDGCYGNVDNVYVEAVADDTAPVLGRFRNKATLTNSTIYVGGGEAAYSSTKSVFQVDNWTTTGMTGTTIYTPYGTPETNATVVKWAGNYHALKVDGENGELVDNPYTKEVKGSTLVSVKMLTSSGAKDMTALSTFADGKVTVDVEDKGVYTQADAQNTYLGRGRIIQIKTDEETVTYTQDLVTYAIDDISDMYAASGYARFFTALTSSTRSYVVLANDILCETTQVIRSGADCANRGAGNYTVTNYGTFDGRGYTVDNAKLYSDTANWTSIFGTVNGTIMKDVSFTNLKTSGGHSYGFFGHNSSALIKNVFIEATASMGTSGQWGSNGNVAVIGRFNQYASITDSTFVIRAPEGETDFTVQKALRTYDGVAKNFTTVKLYTDYAVNACYTFATKGTIAEWDALNA